MVQDRDQRMHLWVEIEPFDSPQRVAGRKQDREKEEEGTYTPRPQRRLKTATDTTALGKTVMRPKD